MAKGLVKGTYAKAHGSAKKGETREFAKSTLEALQAHGILVKTEKKDENKDNKDTK